MADMPKTAGETAIEDTRPKARVEFDNKVEALVAEATAQEMQAAASIMSKSGAPRAVELSPTIAAVILSQHNNINRGLTLGTVANYAAAMSRGEWKLNHQGLASFSDDESLADGQHRAAAVVVSGQTIKTMVYPNFPRDAIDTIDRASKRNAGEALEMQGIHNGKIKATMAKFAMEYTSEVDLGRRGKFSDIQIEEFVTARDGIFDQALDIAKGSVINVTEPCMTMAEAARTALVLLLGNWGLNHVGGFIASVQQGVATYSDAPTVELSRRLTKAKYANYSKDKLSSKEKAALTVKAANLWAQNMTVGRLVWKAAKEELPDYRAPQSIAAE